MEFFGGFGESAAKDRAHRGLAREIGGGGGKEGGNAEMERVWPFSTTSAAMAVTVIRLQNPGLQ